MPMIEKGKISSLQLGLAMYLMIGATSTLIVPAISAKQAKQDMWISPIWGALWGILCIFLAWKLERLYPRSTFVEYSERIVGKVAGKAISFVFLFFLLLVIGSIIREYEEFIILAFLPNTPMAVVVAGIVMASSFAVRSGLEVLVRFAVLFAPLFGLLLAFIFLFLLPDLDWQNVRPVLGYGVMPSIKGAIEPIAWFIEFFAIAFLLPCLRNRKSGLRAGLGAVLAMLATMVLAHLTCLLLFGDLTADLMFPVFSASRFISIADFFSHVESIVATLWLLGGFVQISMWQYALTIGTAQWLKLTDYRPIVFPLGFLVIAFAKWVAPNFQDMLAFFLTTGPVFSLLCLVLIPAALLFIALIRKSFGSGN
ncbi:GerAB/ArcD/ProY family transporter [Cohnella zeiphila]|uniref:Endospore germination permease n=1 Tax=Cohnella zeiphila TaxID=2761120 RepID=A0A7X0SR60_9BACL|nr:endospore germination permease [Cohnella zeiphila]MBB6734645.1 endospore germination permease [Cohnella zeiphila]